MNFSRLYKANDTILKLYATNPTTASTVEYIPLAGEALTAGKMSGEDELHCFVESVEHIGGRTSSSRIYIPTATFAALKPVHSPLVIRRSKLRFAPEWARGKGIDAVYLLNYVMPNQQDEQFLVVRFMTPNLRKKWQAPEWFGDDVTDNPDYTDYAMWKKAHS